MYCEDLLEKAKNGDADSKDQFFLWNRNLIFCFMKDFHVKKQDSEDFEQLCYIAFNQAMESYQFGGLNTICTNLVRMLAFVTCPFFVFQQKNPQNTQERHPQKEG